MNPFDHACDLAELDYDQVENGLITCNVCPRKWTLRPINGKGMVWDNSCETKMPGGHGLGFWTADLKPYPKPTVEQILADRQSRLDMLDQKAAERRRIFQDSKDGLEWLGAERAKEAGPTGATDHEWLAAMLARDRAPKPRRIVSLPLNGHVRLTLRFATIEACAAFLGRIHNRGEPDGD